LKFEVVFGSWFLVLGSWLLLLPTANYRLLSWFLVRGFWLLPLPLPIASCLQFKILY